MKKIIILVIASAALFTSAPQARPDTSYYYHSVGGGLRLLGTTRGGPNRTLIYGSYGAALGAYKARLRR